MKFGYVMDVYLPKVREGLHGAVARQCPVGQASHLPQGGGSLETSRAHTCMFRCHAGFVALLLRDLLLGRAQRQAAAQPMAIQ